MPNYITIHGIAEQIKLDEVIAEKLALDFDTSVNMMSETNSYDQRGEFSPVSNSLDHSRQAKNQT